MGKGICGGFRDYWMRRAFGILILVLLLVSPLFAANSLEQPTIERQ
jgi:hypothetical protein